MQISRKSFRSFLEDNFLHLNFDISGAILAVSNLSLGTIVFAVPDKVGPVLVSVERGRIADDKQTVPCASDCDIHSSVVRDEPQTALL